jgi:hypothetical protein
MVFSFGPGLGKAGPYVVGLWRALRPSCYKPLRDAVEFDAMRFPDFLTLCE